MIRASLFEVEVPITLLISPGGGTVPSRGGHSRARLRASRVAARSAVAERGAPPTIDRRSATPLGDGGSALRSARASCGVLASPPRAREWPPWPGTVPNFATRTSASTHESRERRSTRTNCSVLASPLCARECPPRPGTVPKSARHVLVGIHTAGAFLEEGRC